MPPGCPGRMRRFSDESIMKTFLHTGLVCLPLLAGLAGLAGCSPPRPDAASSAPSAPAPAAAQPAQDAPATTADATPPAESIPAPPPRPPANVDEYKAQVARHVAAHDPERVYTGTLPPLLPAIVVLRITVDRDGGLDQVAVQRSRDPQASAIALAALRRSAPLPPPRYPGRGHGKITFFETFLFADADRYQLRSLAEPQAGE